MLDIGERHGQRTAVVARELPRYNRDIAALQETRLAGEYQLEEVGDGYKFFCIGHPEGQPRQAVVGLIVIRTTLLSLMMSQTHGISPRIMTMHLQWPTASLLDEVPTPEEVQRAVNQISTGKRPEAPTESPLMSSSMEARNCYDTCLICSC